MSVNNIFLSLIILFYTQVIISCQTTPQQTGPASSVGVTFHCLPGDIKRHIVSLTNITTGHPTVVAKRLYTIATIDRKFNALVNGVEFFIKVCSSFPYTANSLAIEELLRNKPKTFPVMGGLKFLNFHYYGDELVKAARFGDIKEVLRLCSFTSLDLDNRCGSTEHQPFDKENRVPLVVAAENGHFEIVKKLLEAGANFELKDSYRKETALIAASKAGHEKIVALLLSYSADVHKDCRDYYNAIAHAAIHDHKKIVTMLSKAGASLDHQDKDGRTALIRCLRYEHNERIDKNTRSLLEFGANPNIQDKDGENALMHATSFYSSVKPPIIKMLLEKKADPNMPNKYGNTPLMYTAMKGEKEKVSSLLAANAKLNHKNNKGHTALVETLLYIADSNEATIIQLLEAGAEVDCEQQYPYTENGATQSLTLEEIVQKRFRDRAQKLGPFEDKNDKKIRDLKFFEAQKQFREKVLTLFRKAATKRRT